MLSYWFCLNYLSIDICGALKITYYCSIAQSCLNLCNPMHCSTPSLPDIHYHPEFAQTHVHWVDDAIQQSHPLPPTSPPALSLTQHQSLFQWVGSSRQVAKVLGLQHQFFQWIFRFNFLQDWQLWSPCCPRDSQESSPIPQFESINSLALSFLYGPTLIFIQDYWEKP